jgi:hypothetical protein
MIRHLICAKGRETELGHCRTALLAIEIHEMAGRLPATGGLEHELNHD